MRCATALRFRGMVVLVIAVVCSPPALAQDRSLDAPLCPAWIERLLFDSYRDIANRQGRPQKSWPGVVFEEQSFAAEDGTQIYGYRAFAEEKQPEEQPAIVIVPGNAMLADQLYEFAAYFALQGFTAYLFDSRGYGGSAGTPRSHVLVKDHREILSRVAGHAHSELAIYAMSFGGIISLVALADAPAADAMVVDGTPAKLPWYAFCPDWLDPVRTLEHAPERTLVISGTDDPVVSPSQMAALRERAQALGMASKVVESFSHPGLDGPETTLRRLALVRDFLRGAGP